MSELPLIKCIARELAMLQLHAVTSKLVDHRLEFLFTEFALPLDGWTVERVSNAEINRTLTRLDVTEIDSVNLRRNYSTYDLRAMASVLQHHACTRFGHKFMLYLNQESWEYDKRKPETKRDYGFNLIRLNNSLSHAVIV